MLYFFLYMLRCEINLLITDISALSNVGSFIYSRIQSSQHVCEDEIALFLLRYVSLWPVSGWFFVRSSYIRYISNSAVELVPVWRYLFGRPAPWSVTSGNVTRHKVNRLWKVERGLARAPHVHCCQIPAITVGCAIDVLRISYFSLPATEGAF